MFEKLIIFLAFIVPILGWFLRKYWEQKLKKELESYKSNLRIKESTGYHFTILYLMTMVPNERRSYMTPCLLIQ